MICEAPALSWIPEMICSSTISNLSGRQMKASAEQTQGFGKVCTFIQEFGTRPKPEIRRQ